MLQKNYTNPLDKGRYGFSASGKFNAPYRLETLLISLAIAGGIVLTVLIVIFALQFVRSNPTGVATGRLLDALFGVGILFAAAVVFGVTGLTVKVIAQGCRCSYIADEEKFMLDYGGSHHTIYYSEVQSIHFLPRSFFKKVHGYTVTVKINGADEEYAITSDGYISESATPFYIIKERMDMLRHEEDVRRTAVQTAPVSDSVKAVQHEDIPLSDKVASILGKDAAMPGISAETRPDIVAANRAKNDPLIPDLPDIARKLSPTVNGYADDMPAVGADGRMIGNTPVYIGTDGREHGLHEIVAAGSFREVMKPGKALRFAVLATLLYMVFYGFMYYIGAVLASGTGGFGSIPVMFFMVIAVLAAPFYAGTVINYLKKGDIYTYKANGFEFVITSASKKEERILYSDVQDVVYNKREFLWFIKGYRVEILTRYGVLKYNYVCEGSRLPSTSTLPFEVIRERISK